MCTYKVGLESGCSLFFVNVNALCDVAQEIMAVRLEVIVGNLYLHH